MKLIKTTESKKAAVVVALSLVALLFQNFDFALQISPIKEETRTAHAKELLGKSYKGSLAQRAESIPALHLAMFNDVYRNLPKKYKNRSAEVTSTIIQEAAQYDFDPIFVVAVVKTESRFNPLARGSFGEIGLMQLKPDTAEWIAKMYGIKWRGPKTLEDPVSNIRIGLAFMDHLREQFRGHASKYVTAYNMGATRVRRMYASEKRPKEYSTRVMKNYNETYQSIIDSTNLSLIAIN